jgi:pyridoxine 5-phosphate synthase
LLVLRESVTTYLNVEMAVTDEMLKIAMDVHPDAVSLVEEKRRELTTERGLDVRANFDDVCRAVGRLRESEIIPSLFIDRKPSRSKRRKRAALSKLNYAPPFMPTSRAARAR